MDVGQWNGVRHGMHRMRNSIERYHTGSAIVPIASRAIRMHDEASSIEIDSHPMDIEALEWQCDTLWGT